MASSSLSSCLSCIVVGEFYLTALLPQNPSIRGEHPSRRGNKVLKLALFLSAFAALRDPISLAYYARKVRTFYEPKSAPNA